MLDGSLLCFACWGGPINRPTTHPPANHASHTPKQHIPQAGIQTPPKIKWRPLVTTPRRPPSGLRRPSPPQRPRRPRRSRRSRRRAHPVWTYRGCRRARRYIRVSGDWRKGGGGMRSGKEVSTDNLLTRACVCCPLCSPFRPTQPNPTQPKTFAQHSRWRTGCTTPSSWGRGLRCGSVCYAVP